MRIFWKNSNSSLPYGSFLFLSFTLIMPVYWILAHILLTPFRFLNALYFDVLLYWSVMLKDSLQELFNPKIGSYRTQSGIRYAWHWLYALPIRFFRFLIVGMLTVVDSFLMFGISLVFPTFTMFHGTRFDGALSNIAQKGTWRVGGGDYVGTGIYFGIRKHVATHYAEMSAGNGEKGIIVARVTLSFNRNVATLPKDVRQHIGVDGGVLTQKMPSLWGSTEHWRNDRSGWWEYCILERQGVGTMVKTWRIRPVILLKANNGKDRPHRLWGGMYHYSLMPSAWFFGLLSWGLIIWILGGLS